MTKLTGDIMKQICLKYLWWCQDTTQENMKQRSSCFFLEFVKNIYRLAGHHSVWQIMWGLNVVVHKILQPVKAVWSLHHLHLPLSYTLRCPHIKFTYKIYQFNINNLLLRPCLLSLLLFLTPHVCVDKIHCEEIPLLCCFCPDVFAAAAFTSWFTSLQDAQHTTWKTRLGLIQTNWQTPQSEWCIHRHADKAREDSGCCLLSVSGCSYTCYRCFRGT